MATYAVQGRWAPSASPMLMHHAGTVRYTLTSAADGTALTGTGDLICIYSDVSGWFHVSTTDGTDKAASTKSHRILADVVNPLGGVEKGMYISFLADA